MMLRFPLVAITRTARILRIPNGSSPLNRLSTSKILNSSSKSNYRLVAPAQHRVFSITTQKCDTHTPIRVPAMAESITEGTLVQLNKKIGDFVEQDEELATIETDKIDVSINAPHTGVIQKLLVSEGDTVTVDQTIAELQHADKGAPESRQDILTEEPENSAVKTNKEVKKSQEHETRLEKPSPSTEYQNATSLPAEDSQSIQDAIDKTGIKLGPRNGRKENKVKMTRIRHKTAQHLKQSQNTAAFLTTFNEVDMSQLMEFRKRNREGVLKKHGIKLGYMGAMARASALALQEIPAVNAAIEDGDTIVYRDYVDLSVAAAIPKGLVTPVLRNIESMGIVEIEKSISTLVAKARDGKLTMDDLMGGSFTISNSGVWGSLFGTPIINMPQTAVLGVYGIQDRPIAVKGQVEIRPMMYIALTYDHRIIDGREAVKFLNIVKSYLEEPSSMLLT